ncbi:hypothetical protein BDV34DRAFT_187622 [Aspergillus parasiticus]|uniref:Uncharacterized protein n=1 Tax=Aspergillus parasiticus TaxID=5067 RepID=A0A5N6DXM6_ASPPA|nr:hypothetical protein BDV34DRAFT_187622 [Aspergillus parasiticus]
MSRSGRSKNTTSTGPRRKREWEEITEVFPFVGACHDMKSLIFFHLLPSLITQKIISIIFFLPAYLPLIKRLLRITAIAVMSGE